MLGHVKKKKKKKKNVILKADDDQTGYASTHTSKWFALFDF